MNEPLIDFERSGGIAGIQVRTSVSPDDDDADRWVQLVDGLDLPALASSPPAAPRGADRFSYDLTIRIGAQRYGMRFGDGDLPDPLRPLVQQLTARARTRR